MTIQKAIAIAPDVPDAYSSLAVIELPRVNYQAAYTLGAKAWAKSDKKNAVIAANYAIACHYAEDPETRDQVLAAARALGAKKMATIEISSRASPIPSDRARPPRTLSPTPSLVGRSACR